MEPSPPADETRQFELEAISAIGPYRVVEKLGVGGMGVVYKCADDSLKRFVAVKVIRAKYAGDEHYRRRFQREAQTIASVSHPSVAHVYGIGELPRERDSLVYIAMEYVDGPSVETLLARRGKLQLAEALRLAREVALGLRAALAKGIVHRDIKPSNLLVTPSGGVKIVDFGLAKELGGQNSMTDEGIVLGTPQYISPEQGRGRAVDHRSDIYSLGATLYHMVTGRPPFEGDSQVSVIVAHVNETPRPPHEIDPGLPATVSRVVLRMLAKNLEERYDGYDSLIADIEAIEAGREPPGAGCAAVSSGPSLGEPGPEPEAAVLSTTTARLESGRRRRRAPSAHRRTWVIGGLVALLVAALAAVWAARDRGSADSPDPSWLGTFYEPLDDGRSLLRLKFGEPPRGSPLAEALRRLLLLRPGNAEAEGAPRLAGGMLRWESFSAPFGIALCYESIDEIRIVVGPTKGSFDFGLALVDPLGSQRRRLLLRLRPMEVTAHPVLAIRNGDEVEPWRPDRVGRPVPRLGPGPFEIFVRLSQHPHEDKAPFPATVVEIRILRRHEGRPLYLEEFTIRGLDWSSGVLVLQTPSPVSPFSVTLERLLISGRLAARPTVEELPWRS